MSHEQRLFLRFLNEEEDYFLRCEYYRKFKYQSKWSLLNTAPCIPLWIVPGCFPGTQQSWADATKTSKPKIIPISPFTVWPLQDMFAGHPFWVSPLFNLSSLSLKNQGVKNLQESWSVKSLQLQNSLIFLRCPGRQAELWIQKSIGSKEI